MEPIDNFIRSVDGFHIEHGGYKFAVHKVLSDLYALDEWHYAVQEPHDALASNQPRHTGTFKGNIGGERHVRKVFFCQSIQIRFHYGNNFISQQALKLEAFLRTNMDYLAPVHDWRPDLC